MRLPSANGLLQETSEKLRPYALRVYPLYIWVIFVPVMLLATVLWFLAFSLCFHFMSPNRAGKVFASTWSRFGLWLAGIHVELEGVENIPKNQSVVVVANHLSHVDIWVLYGHLPVDFRWVLKQELRKVPIIGYSCEKLGHVFVNRGHHADAMASLEKAKQQITGGTSIIFFPEGTRSRNGKLHEFKKGAFHMANDLDLPVLPVSIIGTGQVLPAATLSPAHHPVKMVIHPVIPQPEDKVVETLRTTSHRVIKSSLGE